MATRTITLDQKIFDGLSTALESEGLARSTTYTLGMREVDVVFIRRSDDLPQRDSTRLCIECKWFYPIERRLLSDLPGCANEACGSFVDPVDGRRAYKKCTIEREDREGACGPAGRLYSKREED